MNGNPMGGMANPTILRIKLKGSESSKVKESKISLLHFYVMQLKGRALRVFVDFFSKGSLAKTVRL